MKLNRGTFDFPRLLSIGPLVSSTSKSSKGLSIIRQTINELDSITDAGKVDIFLNDILTSTGVNYGYILPSGLMFSGGTANANGQYNSPNIIVHRFARTGMPDGDIRQIAEQIKDIYFIEIDGTILWSAEQKNPKIFNYISYIVTHEYAHNILNYYSGNMASVLYKLRDADLFQISDINKLDDAGIYPDSQYRTYDSIDGFATHLDTFKTNDHVRPVEAFATVLGHNYASITQREEEMLYNLKTTYRDQYFDLKMQGNIPEKYQKQWVRFYNSRYDTSELTIGEP